MEPFIEDDPLGIFSQAPIGSYQEPSPVDDQSTIHTDFDRWMEQQYPTTVDEPTTLPPTTAPTLVQPYDMVPNSGMGLYEIQLAMVEPARVESPLPDNYTRPPKRVRFEAMGVGKDMKDTVAIPGILAYNTGSFHTAIPKTNDITVGNESMAAFNMAVYLMEKKIKPETVKQIGVMFANRACLNCVETTKMTGVPKCGDVVKGEMYCNTCLASKNVIQPPTAHEQFDKWLQQPFHKWCYNMKAE
jgi:hypothetical protein